jgi:hypothetical protein
MGRGMTTDDDITSLAAVRRALLVEFIDTDRFPGQIAEVYPLLKGYCRGRGAEVRWIRYGIGTANFFAHGMDAVTLTDAELLKLTTALDEVKPELIVTTHPLRGEQVAAVKTRRPGVKLALAHDLTMCELARSSPAAFRAQAELDRAEFTPDYRWEPGNQGALRRDRHNIYVTLRAACGYRKSSSRNPCYADVTMGTEVRTVGCAFCGRTPAQATAATQGPTPREWIVKQVTAIQAAYHGDAAPNALMFENLESARVMTDVLDVVQQIGMRGTKLFFAIRVDRLLDMEAHLRSALPQLARAGNAIHLHVMGLENFADEELQRLNKGFNGLSALRAVNLIQELQGAHPESFHYSEYRPLAMILFTPWTTPEVLDLNFGLIQHLGIETDVGNVFVARLRLHPDLAITALTRHDGLLVDSVSDEALLLNRRKLFERELPWRFRDPRLELVNSIATRLEGDGAFAGDPLSGVLEGLMRHHAPASSWDQRARVGLLRCIVDAARMSDQPLPAEALLATAFEMLQALRAAAGAAPPPRTRFALAGKSRTARELLAAVAPLLAKLKPVVSLAHVPRKLLTNEALALLKTKTLRHEFVPEPGTPDVGTLLVGKKAALARALELEAALRSKPDAAAARAELGQLYGYPECCARAWAESAWAPFALERWALAAGRAERPGPISPWLQPLAVPDLMFVPCACDCAAAADRYRAWLERLGAPVAKAVKEERAWLALLEGFEPPIAVRPTGSAPDGLCYDRADVLGEGPLRDLVAGGDRLQVVSAQVQVRDDDRVLDAWTASVLLWDARQAYRAAEWAEVARAALRRARLPDGAGQAQRSREAGGDAAGDSERQSLRVTLRAPADATVDFHVARFAPGQPFFKREGDLVLWYTRGDLGPATMPFAEVLLAAMKQLQAQPLSADAAPRWQEAVTKLAARAGLKGRFEWDLEWVPGPG